VRGCIAAQKSQSKLKFVMLDKEINTPCRQEEFQRICSDENLVEKAQEIEVTIPVKKSQETLYKCNKCIISPRVIIKAIIINLDPVSFSVNYFWGRRPDAVAINEALQVVCILEFKQSIDREERFLEVKEAEENEQYKSIISALRLAAGKQEFE